MITTGAWIGQHAPVLASLAVPERQVLAWLQPHDTTQFTPDRFPVFNLQVPEGRYYGLPIYGVPGFKFGRYGHLGEPVDPDHLDRDATAADEDLLRSFAESYFPTGAGPTMALRACMFTNTPDGHFIIDRHPDHPNVILASPCSGHGYKFCPVIGEVLADLATTGETGHDISLFRLDRFTPADARSRSGTRIALDRSVPHTIPAHRANLTQRHISRPVELRRQDDLAVLTIDPPLPIQQQLSRNLAHRVGRLHRPDHRRSVVVEGGRIVEGRHGDIIRHPQARMPDRPQTAHRQTAITQQDRLWPGRKLEQFGYELVARARIERSDPDQIHRRLHARGRMRLAIPVEPVDAGRVRQGQTHVGDPRPAILKQSGGEVAGCPLSIVRTTSATGWRSLRWTTTNRVPCWRSRASCASLCGSGVGTISTPPTRRRSKLSM